MRRIACLLVAAAAAVGAPSAAQGAEIFGGAYVHDIDSPLSISGVEKGADIQIGWRGGRFGRTPIQPYVYGSVHTAGKTHFAAAGLSARFGRQIYIRPGVGVAVHTGSAKDFQDPTNDEIEFGSRILFAPELGIGAHINDRVSVEASWIHLSHAQRFGRQNPGMDSVGVRVNVGF